MVDDVLQTQPFVPGGARPAGPRLLVLEGARTGAVHPVTARRTTLGRHPDNDLHLPSTVVSKHHAAICLDEGRCFIEDLGSTNGVLVNGARIPPDTRRRLFHGDNIRLSDHLLLFQHEVAFTDGSGACCIELDQAAIDGQADELLADWRAVTRPST